MYALGIVIKANTACHIIDGINEQTNIASSKVPWLHNLRRSLFVPAGFVPTNAFNRIKSGIIIKSIYGKAFTNI